MSEFIEEIYVSESQSFDSYPEGCIEEQIDSKIRSEVSSILPENYELGNCLAEGAMGKVYLTVNTKNGDSLAAKIISRTGKFESCLKRQKIEKSSVIKHLADIKNEASIQKKLKHPHIASFYGSKISKKFIVMFMELINGGDLFERIPIGIGLNIQQMFSYYSQILEALNYLHKEHQVMHLDVKPENIMINSKDKAKLVDFGWANIYSLDKPIYGPVGTTIYAPPEIWNPNEPITFSADYFSLGVTLLTAVTGERLWSSASSEDEVFRMWKRKDSQVFHLYSPFDRLPADLINFAIKALDPDPKTRFTYEDIKKHPWFLSGLGKKLSKVNPPTSDKENYSHVVVSSQQPEKLGIKESIYHKIADTSEQDRTAFSQPSNSENIFMASQAVLRKVNMDHLMKRVTRFISTSIPEKKTIDIIVNLINQRNELRLLRRYLLGFLVESKQGLISTTFRIGFYRISKSVMVDFRRVSGDSFLFHQTYGSIFKELKDQGIIDSDNPCINKLLP